VAFEIGDKVIYPNHGLGVIERIETKTIMGTTCGFYQLRMASETTVFVPVDNVDGVGLRRAINDDEVGRLFNLLGDGNIDSHQNWKGRFKDNSDRMRTGSIYDVVEVLKSLTFLAKSKSLSFREKRMLDRAKFLVVSEITEVLSEKTPAVEDRVDKALECCFVAKAKNAGTRPKPAPMPAPAPMPPMAVKMAPVPQAKAAPAPAPVAKPAPAPVAKAAPVAVAKAAPAPVAKAAAKAAPAPAAKAVAPVKAATHPKVSTAHAKASSVKASRSKASAAARVAPRVASRRAARAS